MTPSRRTTARADAVDEQLLAEIARRYYVADSSKVEIAESLGLSRFKVARLLAQAKATGIVKISISSPSGVDASLSARLAGRLGLDRCIVVDTTGGVRQARMQVATAAAQALPDMVRGGDRLGLTWSRTVEALVDALPELPQCTVVQLAGSVSPTGGGALDLVQRAARLAGGVAHAVHAPLVVDNAAVATALRRQTGISDTLRLADTLDVSVVAIGAWQAGCSTVWEAVSPEVREAGLAAGAVAEVSGRLVGPAGEPIISPLDDLVIAASLEQLRRASQRVGMVSGPHRAPATVAAVRAGLVTTLVTTGNLARAVLRLPVP